MAEEKKIAYVVTGWMIIPVEFVVGRDIPANLFARAGVEFNNLGRELIVVTDERGSYLPVKDIFVCEGGYYQKINNPANILKGEIRKLPEEREGSTGAAGEGQKPAEGHSEDET